MGEEGEKKKGKGTERENRRRKSGKGVSVMVMGSIRKGRLIKGRGGGGEREAKSGRVARGE